MHFNGWTTVLLVVGIVLFIIAIIMGYIAEVAQPEGMPQWLPHAYHFCFIGSFLFMGAVSVMRLVRSSPSKSGPSRE
jgi:uncharacterized membrane protein